MSPDDGYLLDNRQREAGTRFDEIGALFDPGTFRHLDRIGIGAGWRCWEVGTGGASVPRELARRVAPGGRVLATDLDLSWAASAAEDGVELRRHDVGTDAPPDGSFDLVHARLVLVHVVRRESALRSMIEALRPGGWLLVEDADPALQPLACPDEPGPAERLANSIRRGFRALLASRGAEMAYGRTLPRLLREAGLVDVEAEVWFPLGGPTCSRLEAATVTQLRPLLVAHGHATHEELDAHLAALAAGSLDLATAPMVSVRGRRPDGPDSPEGPDAAGAREGDR